MEKPSDFPLVHSVTTDVHQQILLNKFQILVDQTPQCRVINSTYPEAKFIKTLHTTVFQHLPYWNDIFILYLSTIGPYHMKLQGMKSFLLLWGVMLCTMVQGQNGSVGIGTTAPSENAILHLASPDKNKGFMLPVYTTQERNATAFTSKLNTSDNGLMIYDSELKQVLIWKDNKWVINGLSSGFYAVDPSDFTALHNNYSELDDNHLLIFAENSNFVTLRRTTRANGIIAPLHLPHGAVIEEVEVYYWDNAGSEITVEILRKAWTGESESILSSPWSSDANNEGIRSAIIDNIDKPLVDNENFSYRIKASMFFGGSEVDHPEEADHRLYGVKIKYNY